MDGDDNAKQEDGPVKGIDLPLNRYCRHLTAIIILSLANPLEKVHSYLCIPLSAFFNDKVRH